MCPARLRAVFFLYFSFFCQIIQLSKLHGMRENLGHRKSIQVIPGFPAVSFLPSQNVMEFVGYCLFIVSPEYLFMYAGNQAIIMLT